jgi:N-acetyl sugar amidotransferase
MLIWCKNCLNVSTRPRIQFNEEGVCNACSWVETKKSINWDMRLEQLKKLIYENRELNKKQNYFDCIVPVSGGKDGSYVSYKLKHEYGINPLTVTIRPPLERDIGRSNLQNFIDSGYEHIHVSPSKETMRQIDKFGFTNMGFPYLGWLTAMQAAPVVLAAKLDINLIIYGEDGEVEYGGSTKTITDPIYSTEYMKNIYLEGGYEKALSSLGNNMNRYFFTFPDGVTNLKITHWSYYENWDPYRNYVIAKDKCGLIETTENNIGTFTNFSQNDQKLYALHCYLMYLKFGFGRATQDAGIEIRRGSLTREQAIPLVELYDHQFPSDFLEDYLTYYEISEEEFFETLDKFANKELFKKNGKYWQPNFKIV